MVAAFLAKTDNVAVEILPARDIHKQANDGKSMASLDVVPPWIRAPIFTGIHRSGVSAVVGLTCLQKARRGSVCMEHLDKIIFAVERRRRFLGMSAAELARRAHVDGKRLRRVLSGERIMSADELVRVCAVLKIQLSALEFDEAERDGDRKDRW